MMYGSFSGQKESEVATRTARTAAKINRMFSTASCLTISATQTSWPKILGVHCSVRRRIQVVSEVVRGRSNTGVWQGFGFGVD